MNGKRFYWVMIGVSGLLALGIFAAAYFGNGVLAKQANKLVGLKLDSRVADEQQTSLTQAKKDIEKYSELEKEAKAIVPQDKDQAEAIREIVKIAAISNVRLGNISFPTSNLGQGAAVVASAPSGTTASTSSTVKPPSVTQVTPVTGIPGLYAMQITIQSDSQAPTNYNSLISFLSRLEQNRRTAQVTSVTIQPDKIHPDQLTFTLVLNVYIKP